jgi:uncharacterized membrane protein YedE/YeeE
MNGQGDDTLPATTTRVGELTRSSARSTQQYMNPYLAGVGIGLVLLAAFVIMGRGLGASGAFSTIVSAGVSAASPEHARDNAFYAFFAGDGSSPPLADWLVFEIVGITLGAVVSGWLAGRFRLTSERGPRIGPHARFVVAVAGGAMMGFGAMLARGCTSGLALTGGALLAPGAWIFVVAAFASAYAAAPLLRRQWR